MKVLRSRHARAREVLWRSCRREALVGSGQSGLPHLGASSGASSAGGSMIRESCDDQDLGANLRKTPESCFPFPVQVQRLPLSKNQVSHTTFTYHIPIPPEENQQNPKYRAHTGKGGTLIEYSTLYIEYHLRARGAGCREGLASPPIHPSSASGRISRCSGQRPVLRAVAVSPWSWSYSRHSRTMVNADFHDHASHGVAQL